MSYGIESIFVQNTETEIHIGRSQTAGYYSKIASNKIKCFELPSIYMSLQLVACFSLSLKEEK